MYPPLLYIEDDEDDIFLVKQAFEGSLMLKSPFIAFSDGLNIVDRLNSMTALPAVILLDLNMPVKNGFEVLKDIKDSVYHSIPVVILSTSSDEKNVSKAYRLGANSYLTKPGSYAKMKELVSRISEYWLNSNLREKYIKRI